MSAWIGSGSDAIEPLFELLADRAQAEPSALPSTGVSLDRERRLSSAFIVDDVYGTRCSTVLTMSREGEARFIERSFDRHGVATGEARFEFRI